MRTCANMIFAYYVLTGQRFSWLFPQLNTVLHHGGAGGTTGASARYIILSSYLFTSMTMATSQ